MIIKQKIKIYFSLLVIILIISLTTATFVVQQNLSQIKRPVSAEMETAANQNNLTTDVFADIESQKYNFLSQYNYLIKGIESLSDNACPIVISTKTDPIPVLLYHGIVTEADGTNVLVENFIKQMIALKKASYTTITLSDFYQYMRGNKRLPEKSFLLTFDDGRKDSFYPVDSILELLDYNAVMFVITEHLDNQVGQFYLAEPEINYMLSSGRWEIQSHGHQAHNSYPINQHGDQAHFLTNKLYLVEANRLESQQEYQKRITSDLLAAQEILKNKFNRDIIAFAFPSSDYGQSQTNCPDCEQIILNTTKKIYQLAFYQADLNNDDKFNYPLTDTFMIKRITVLSDWDENNLLNIMKAGNNKKLPLDYSFTNQADWIKSWGGLEINNSLIQLKATESSQGSAIFLDGSRNWQNYELKAVVNLKQGNYFSLVAHYQDNNNYLSCNYGLDSITLKQKVNGIDQIILTWYNDFTLLKNNDQQVGIYVFNNIIRCSLNDEYILRTYRNNQLLNYGGIGFKTWDEQINHSELIIKKINVKAIEQYDK